MAKPKPPKQGWVRSWPGAPNDGTYYLHGRRVGRVILLMRGTAGGNQDTWQWFFHKGHPPSKGLAESKEGAKAEVEKLAAQLGPPGTWW